MKNKLKRIFAYVLIGMMIFSLSSCSLISKKQVYSYDAYTGSNQVESNFTNVSSPESVLASLSNVNFSETFNDFIANAKKSGKVDMKTEKNDEDSTAINSYYIDKTKICAVYDGYGEECWEKYATDNDGNNITVQYFNQSSNDASVVITSNKKDSKKFVYSASFENLDSKLLYGAKNITLTFTDDSGNFNQIITYTIDLQGKNYVSRINSAFYTDKEGNYCHAWYDEETKQATSITLVGLVSNTDLDKYNSIDVNSIKESNGFKDIEMIIGRHKTFVDNKGVLYIVGDLYVVFDDETTASAFSSANKLDKPSNSYSDECYSVTIKNVVLKVASDCRVPKVFNGVSDLLTHEIDDPEFMALKFNNSGEILDFSVERQLNCN